MERYDLVVIGAGPSGYAAAMRALDFKKKTLLIERDRVGGAGVTNGALSSKTWWELSREVASFRKNLKKFNLHVPDVNYREVQQEVRNAIKERKSMLEDHMMQMQDSRHAHLLTFKKGNARLVSRNEVVIDGDQGKDLVWADYIVLATGSRPRYLPELPIDEKIVVVI